MDIDVQGISRRATRIAKVPPWFREDSEQAAALAILTRPRLSEGEAVTVGIYAAKAEVRYGYACRGGKRTLLVGHEHEYMFNTEAPPPSDSPPKDITPILAMLSDDEKLVLSLRVGYLCDPMSSEEAARMTGWSMSKTDRMYAKARKKAACTS